MTTAFESRDDDAQPAQIQASAEAEHSTGQAPQRAHLRVIDGHRPDDSPRQMALPLHWRTDGVPAAPAQPGYLRVVPDDDERAELAATAQGRPHPVRWTAQIARVIYEVANGERPASQLRRHVARDQLATLSIRGTSVARHPSSRGTAGLSRLRQVRAVRCCMVAPGVVEASAVIVGAARSHAVALRLEAQQTSWLVTAVEFR